MNTTIIRVCGPATRFLLAACLLAAGGLAQANPVTLHYTGTTTNTYSTLVSAGLPDGSAFSLDLNFNETFSDGTYNVSDNLGPVSGTMSVGGFSYSMLSYLPNGITYTNGTLSSVSIQFTGTGPDIGVFDFYGLLIAISTDLTIKGVTIGYETDAPQLAPFHYADVDGRGTITPQDTNDVPLPGTLPLVMLGLAALSVRRKLAAGAA